MLFAVYRDSELRGLTVLPGTMPVLSVLRAVGASLVIGDDLACAAPSSLSPFAGQVHTDLGNGLSRSI